MSIGQIIGGGLGFAIGWAFGAPWLGLMIGMGVGAMVDPLTPDVPVPGMPELGNLNISTADEGPPIKDVLGTTKIASGNILWYGAQHVVEITEEVETGGKGGGGTETVVTGYNYYVSWALGICMGPVDTLYTIYNGDDVVWSGELNRPLAGGEETIVLTDMGSMTFYFGTDDQVANATLTSKLEDATLSPAYRHQCYAFFNDCCTGQHERIPTMKFVLRKSPTFAFNANETIQTYDYNTAHAIYYILNTLLEIPTTYLNATSFSDAADTLHAESHGISMLLGSQAPALTYLGESLLSHIDGILRWGNDGKFHPKLIRADEAVGALPSFDENDMLDTLELNRKSWYDTKNEIKVQYSERIVLGGFEPVAGNITVIDSWEWDDDILFSHHNPVKIPAAWEGEGEALTPYTTYWTIAMLVWKWGFFFPYAKIDTFQIGSKTGLITKVLTDQRNTNINYGTTYWYPHFNKTFFSNAYYFISSKNINSLMLYPAGNIGEVPTEQFNDLEVFENPLSAITLTGLGTLCCALTTDVGIGSRLRTFQVNAVGGFGTETFIDSYDFIYTADLDSFALAQTHMVGMIACCYTVTTLITKGYIFTLGIDIAGDIEDTAYDSYQFAEGLTVEKPQLIWMAGTDTDSVYTLIYYNGISYTIKTINIDNFGIISLLDSDTSTCANISDYIGICKIDRETIAVVGRDSLFGGRIYLYHITSEGTISELGTSLRFDAVGSLYDFKITSLGNNFYIVSYMKFIGGLEHHGYCTILKIV